MTPRDNLAAICFAFCLVIASSLAQKTPLTAYYENRYVEELEREGFFKKLWQ